LLGTGAGEKSGRKRYIDAVLILGTPLAGAAAQWKVFSHIDHGYALVCALFAAGYLVLALILLKRRAPGIMVEGYLGLSVLLANLIIPLELSPQISGAIWAAEGVLIFYWGIRQNNRRILAAGTLTHIAAALAFVFEGRPGDYGALPFRSGAFTGSLVIALSAMVIIVLARREKPRPGKRNLEPFSLGAALWAFTWWFLGWARECGRALDRPGEVFFILCSATALASFAGAKLFRAPVLRLGGVPAPVFALLLIPRILLWRAVNYLTDDPARVFTYNFFTGLYRWGWPVFFLGQGGLLFFSRKDLKAGIRAPWLFTVILGAALVLTTSGRAFTEGAGLSEPWTGFAGILPTLAATFLLAHVSRRIPALREIPPPGAPGHRKLIFFALPLILNIAAGLWFLTALFLPGNPIPPLRYVPVISPLDLEQALCAAAILVWQDRARKVPAVPAMGGGALFALGDGMIFLWITAIIARGVHFYGGIPFYRVPGTEIFHLCLFIFWALWGIGHIIGGHRASRRAVWIAGTVLTILDVAKLLILDLANTGAVTRIVSFFIAGLLLLFIGWAAPLPPAVRRNSGDGPSPS
ncbi:MAG: DUF2339 domain-containing protein, partial [Spirochaetaceae bacterium]|nr:DUF2339 domain-containing protein [Spirochaetaceae bacterium]